MLDSLFVSFLKAALACVCVLLVGSCIYFADQADQDAWKTRNRDPRQGTVWFTENHTEGKVCDGTTLLYKTWVRDNYVLNPVPSSPECAP